MEVGRRNGCAWAIANRRRRPNMPWIDARMGISGAPVNAHERFPCMGFRRSEVRILSPRPGVTGESRARWPGFLSIRRRMSQKCHERSLLQPASDIRSSSRSSWRTSRVDLQISNLGRLQFAHPLTEACGHRWYGSKGRCYRRSALVTALCTHTLNYRGCPSCLETSGGGVSQLDMLLLLFLCLSVLKCFA